MKKIPNILTFSRIILTVFFCYFYLTNSIILATIIFLIASLTDTLDGWIARKFNVTSKWGALYDPLADKFLTSATFICFAISGIVEKWMVAVIILRDIITTILRFTSFAEKKISTSKAAKFKTFLQMFVILGILFLLSTNNLSILYSDYTYFAMLFLTLLTVWTMIEYIRQLWKAK